MLTPRDQLLASHEEFQKLAQEHTQYAQRLDSLTKWNQSSASIGSIRSLNSCPDLARRSRQRVHTLKSTALISAFFIGI